MIVGAVGMIILFLCVPGLLFFYFSKTRKPSVLGRIYSVLHLCVAVALSLYVYIIIPKDYEAAMLLFPLYVLDVPVSVIAIFISFLIEKVIGYKFMVIHLYVPAAVFIVLGSIQYFFVGKGIGRLVNRLKAKKTPSQQQGA